MQHYIVTLLFVIFTSVLVAFDSVAKVQVSESKLMAVSHEIIESTLDQSVEPSVVWDKQSVWKVGDVDFTDSAELFFSFDRLNERRRNSDYESAEALWYEIEQSKIDRFEIAPSKIEHNNNMRYQRAVLLYIMAQKPTLNLTTSDAYLNRADALFSELALVYPQSWIMLYRSFKHVQNHQSAKAYQMASNALKLSQQAGNEKGELYAQLLQAFSLFDQGAFQATFHNKANNLVFDAKPNNLSGHDTLLILRAKSLLIQLEKRIDRRIERRIEKRIEKRKLIGIQDEPLSSNISLASSNTASYLLLKADTALLLGWVLDDLKYTAEAIVYHHVALDIYRHYNLDIAVQYAVHSMLRAMLENKQFNDVLHMIEHHKMTDAELNKLAYQYIARAYYEQNLYEKALAVIKRSKVRYSDSWDEQDEYTLSLYQTMFKANVRLTLEPVLPAHIVHSGI